MSTPERQKNKKRKVEEEGRQDKRSRYWTVHPKMRRGSCEDRGAGTRGTGREDREKREKGGSPRAWSFIIFVHLDLFPFSASLFLETHNVSGRGTTGALSNGQSYVKIKLSRILTLFIRSLAFSIPILCLLISQCILSSSRPHKHQAVRSVPRKRILDQYFCVFALQGVCLCSLLFCSLLTFTPQKNTRAGQGGVVLHCWGSVLPCRGTHAHEHTRSIPLLRSISKAGRRSVALQWFCLSHEGALTQTILPVCAARRLAR